ncbi:phage repressor protein C with HTH and peptisase S24 domain [Paraburkholderia sp. JPY465]|uniref:XRE family transcriptional regulator n=1 Tax=Paraburkholderia sp. JPY465 TaxID=3042285 RepID=UPI003D2555CA
MTVNNFGSLTGYSHGYTLPGMETMGERVRARRKQLGMSQAELAVAVGCSQPSIKKIEAGGKTTLLLELAKALQVDVQWLKSGGKLADNSQATHQVSENNGESQTVSLRPIVAWDSEEELGDEYIFLPRLRVKLSAGEGTLLYEIDEKGQRQAFRKAWAQRLGVKQESAATMVADGMSMEPRIQDGDSLVVDYKETWITSGKVYAIAFAGEVYVKRLFKRPDGGVRIVSDNPDKTRYPDWDVEPQMLANLQIIARIIAVSGAV